MTIQNFGVVVLLWLQMTWSVSAQQGLHLHTRDGDLITVDFPAKPLRFTVFDDALSSIREIQWSDLSSLHLVQFQLSQQTQRVEELLEQLADRDYEKREYAELLLGDVDKFGPFESLIKNAARDSTNVELIYRLQRVLDRLEEYNGPAIGNFDELVLKSGDSIRGDAGEFSLQLELFGKSVRFSRENLLRITAEKPTSKGTEFQPLQIKTHNRPFPAFYKNEDKLVSFENLSSGEPVPLGENALDMFVAEGLRFRTEDAGYVGTLWYPFKLCPIEPGKKCICPFDETARVAKRLWGTTLITFCLPGQPGVSAGVKKFGLFLEKIDHSRDAVVEAYNAAGQMIGMVEASDQKCVFAGFETNELITCVRVAKNANLPKLSRRIDPSYAIDCVTYAGLEPVQTLYDPVPGSVDAMQVKLGLANGNTVDVTQLVIDETSLSFESGLIKGKSKCDITEVSSLNFNRSRRFAASENDYLMVQLSDSSIVKTEIDTWMQPFDFLDSKISEEQIVGIWSGRHASRMVESADFESNQPVIAYPSCRIIATDFRLRKSGFSWDKDRSEKRVQKVKLFEADDSRVTREEAKDPDFTPDVSQIEFRDSAQIPCLWLKQPKTIDSQRGCVFLTDGQYFVLNGESGFTVSRMGSKNVEIKFGNSKKLYPLTRISSIKLPSK